MVTLIGVLLLAATKGEPLPPKDVFARASPGVGYVVAGANFGSVVAVSKNRVVTNWHVVEEAAKKAALQIRVGQVESRAVLVGVDTQRDIAILQLLSGELRVVPERRADLPAVGEKVFTIGSPSGLANTFADGLVSNLQPLKDITLIQTTAAISKGSSGGGLFDDRARLVGITTLYMREGQQLNFAVPTKAVEEALGTLFKQPEVGTSVKSLPADLQLTLKNALPSTERFALDFALAEDAPLPPGRAEEPVTGADAAQPVPRTKTDPARWSKDGWSDFRWGMGAADVEERLRQKGGKYRATDFTCVPGDRPSEVVCDCFDDQHSFRWEGGTPNLSFWFYDQELLSVEVALKVAAEKTDATLKSADASLTKALGLPKERRVARDGEPAVVRWASSSMRAELSLLAPTTRVKQWQLVLNYADDERERRSRGLPPLQLVSVADAAKKTPSKVWSSFGWNDFRWGMGPGDVAALMSKKDGDFRCSSFECEKTDIRENSFGCHSDGNQHSFTVLGASPALSFEFFAGELWEVLFMFSPDVEAGRSMFRALEAKLVEKYGKPTYRRDVDLSSRDMVNASVEWESPALTVKLELLQPPEQYWARGSSISVSYLDPVRYEAFKRAPIPKSAK